MKKINITNILKHCPKGMKLDCTIWGWNIEFDHINIKDEYYPIVCHDKLPDGKYNIRTFTKYGYYSISDSKCVIFPKGETTWEGFAPPCKFKDGDIIYTKHKLGTEFVSIFRVEYERDICIYWNMNLSTNKLIGYLHDGKAFKVFIEKDKVKEQRFATEEEKQKLFKAFNDNGYTWNAETKTLDKLPKFKVVDRIKIPNCDIACRVTNMTWNDIEIEYETTNSDVTFFADELQPYKEETMDRKYNVEEYLKVWEETEKGLEVVVNDRFELKENNGKFYIIKKQPQYPKTYEECAEILLERASVRNDIGYKGDLLINLQRLLICRDAYWFIYNNWKPTHKSGCDNTIYTIHKFNEEVIKGATSHRHSLLEFPTEEMRDKFYENFKTLIFACKELI